MSTICTAEEHSRNGWLTVKLNDIDSLYPHQQSRPKSEETNKVVVNKKVTIKTEVKTGMSNIIEKRNMKVGNKKIPLHFGR